MSLLRQAMVATRRRAPLLVASVVAAAVCVQAALAFSSGDLVISNFGGRTLSTLQLVVLQSA